MQQGSSVVPVPEPSYSHARETLVKAIPPNVICLLACGGRDCRFEGPACWRPSQQAIKGIFSSWVTDDIVAMARPSTHLINKYNIIDQFKKLNIKSIINMQLPGEHAHCGPELETESGFTYSPQSFMENQIYFYNFGMSDFGVSSMEAMLDAVKVLAFSVQEGKVAVHCHAGLGRTGVLIACYLIYTLRISASEAVHYVRIKRPCSIQTETQINLVFDFVKVLRAQLIQYPCLGMQHGEAFSLKQYLRRQALLLHGEEARSLEHTPKILRLLCILITALAEEAASLPEMQMELERKAAVLVLQQVVRDTLVLQRYLPVLSEGKDSCGSVSLWDEPFGFIERKREVLLNKRSFSESDLSKITLNKPWYRLFGKGDKVCNGISSQLNDQQPSNPESNILISGKCNSVSSSIPCLCKSNNDRRTTCMMKKSKAFTKFSSNIELRKNQQPAKVSLTSNAVAKAMAQCDPAGEKILQRAALLQEELNVSAYGWATLAMETEPKVLSALMWTWLENLKEPVLSADDIAKMTNIPDQNPLKVLHKISTLQINTEDIRTLKELVWNYVVNKKSVQSRHQSYFKESKAQSSTLCCLLGCVAQVTAQCPQLETAILLKLIQALTRRHPTEDTANYNTLLKMFGANIRDKQRKSCIRSAIGTSTSIKTS